MSTAVLAALPAFLTLAAAGDEKSAIEGLRLGEHWYGPKLATEDLKGRVVLVELWGRH
jgi:hypothetical protein